MTREERAFACSRKWKPSGKPLGINPPIHKSPPEPPKPSNPKRVMLVTGPDWTAQIAFEQKFGIWFWMNCTRPLYAKSLEDYGTTLVAIERMCRRENLQSRWL